jgi:alkylation response protein AidB-like acyl-CoA dehydrogenase
VSGTKIFVSAGEHDFADNIVHLVLARLADAPAGTRGISLFVVQIHSQTVTAARPAQRSALHRRSSRRWVRRRRPRARSNFPGDGMARRRAAPGLARDVCDDERQRSGAAIQGLGIAEAAYQDAVAYARHRTAGRALDPKRQRSDVPADPIIVHPDVRRMLLTMRVYVEGMRMLGRISRRRSTAASGIRMRPHDRMPDDYLGLMTPVAKALFSDLGFECANLGLQVLGGHGYIRAHGMEQYVRDVRIATDL